jgi:ribosomal protein S30
MLTDKNNKKYSNEHPKGKKPTEEENIKLAKTRKFTIKIDPMKQQKKLVVIFKNIKNYFIKNFMIIREKEILK